jgi:Anti-sigma-K factor rskA, C-terminal/Putative zinc-finger
MSDRTPDTERDEHWARWGDEIAAYALDALSGDDLDEFTAHLSDCPICAERLRWLAPAVDVLPAAVAPQRPPPALKSRLMDVVNREAEMIEASEDPNRSIADGSRRAHGGDRGSRFLGLSLRPALAGLGVALLLVAGIVGYAINDSGTDGTTATTYEATADEPGSPATGMLAVEGDAGSLHVANLPATHRGEVYQAWIQDESGPGGGAVHPSSVFVVAEGGEGDVAIPHGLSEARRVMVTREPKGGSKLPSENPVLTAEMG